MKTLTKWMDLRKLAKAMKQVFAVMVALSFMSLQALAATVTVTAATDTGAAGELSVIFPTANQDADIVTFVSGIGGAIQDGGDLTTQAAIILQPGDTAVTIANDITLAAAKGLTIDLANTVAGGLSSNVVMSGVLKGAGGAVTIKNSGGTGTATLTLSGVNTYDSGTTIDGTAAVIAIYSDAAAFGTGAVTVNGGNNAILKTGAAVNPANNFTLTNSLTIDNADTATTFSGVFSGAGGLTIKNSVDGASAVTLTGANTFTGGATIDGANSAGVLNVTANHATALGAGSLTMTGFSGAKLATLTMAQALGIGTLIGDANSRIANGGNLLTTVPTADSTWAGIISGGGGLTVNGAGTLTLTGANTYTGATTVAAGTLKLGVANGAGAAGAAGALTTNAGGTFDMGTGFAQQFSAITNNGTIKTGIGVLSTYGGGAYNAGTGTLEVQPTAGVKNLTIAGAATLTNQTLQVSGSPLNGTYNVVNAAALGGTFAAINMQRGFLLDAAAYTATDLNITISAGFAATQVAGETQESLLPALNTTLGSDNVLAADLGSLSGAQLAPAMNKITPVSAAAMNGLGAAGASLQAGAVAQRVAGLAQGMSHPDGDRVAILNGFPGQLVAEPLGDTGAAGSSYASDSPWGVFASALHNYGRLDSHDGNLGFQPGYKFYTTGGAAGIDYRVNEHFAVGVSGGFTTGKADLLDHYGFVNTESLRYGVYGVGYVDAFHADLYVGGAKDFFDIERNIVFGRKATASPQGTEFNVDSRIAYDWDLSPAVVSPYAGLTYDRMSIGSYSETGAGTLNLSVNKQTTKSLRTTLGTKIEFEIKAGAVVWSPYVNLGWQKENAGQDRSIDSQFITGGGAFSVKTADEPRNALIAGVGMGVDLKKNASARVGYTMNKRSNFRANTFDGSLRFRF